MQYNYSFKEVLGTLGPSYRSVDLRAILAALGDSQGWRCVFAAVRFSRKSPQEIAALHDSLKAQYELTDNMLNRRLGQEFNEKPFRGLNVELSAYDINRFPQIVNRFSVGLINASNRSFRLWDETVGTTLETARMSWRNDAYACDYDEWPTYYLGLGQRSLSLESPDGRGGLATSIQENDLNVWASEAGFSTIRDIFERLLAAPYDQGDKFEIRAPVYARVDDVITAAKAVNVQGSVSRQLGNLTLECSIRGRSGPRRDATPAKTLGRTTINQDPQGGDIRSFSSEFPLDSQTETGNVTSILYKQGGSRMDLGETRTTLHSGIPFFKTYSSFILETDLEEYLDCLAAGQKITDCQLYRKFGAKNSSKKIDELLEYVTTHLLGLCQLNPILLSNPQYDVVNGGMNAGSADILAMTREQEPLLVSCTMAMPDARKPGMLLSARTAISERFGWSEGDIKVLLVTGKPSASQPDADVKTLAATDLQQLWASVKEGDLIAAWSLLGVYRYFA